MHVIFLQQFFSILTIIAIVVGIINPELAFAAGTTDNKTVTISATIAENLTLACNNAAIATSIVAGTPQSVQASCVVTTNGSVGFNLKVRKTTAASDATKTLVNGTTWITDTGTGLTAYDGTLATTAIWGASTTKGLGFRVRSTTGGTTYVNTMTVWGVDETAGNARYAAFPATTDRMVYNYGSYSASAATVNIDYKLDVTGTQMAGAYSGTVLYTATTN